MVADYSEYYNRDKNRADARLRELGIDMKEAEECYRRAEDTGIDNPAAMEWYQKAAELGYAPAQYRLAWHYRFGQGIAKDEEKAFSWDRTAAEQDYPPSQNTLASCYRHGWGVEKDDEKALFWLQKAVDGDNVHAIIDLSRRYGEGEGVPKDHVKAVELLIRAEKIGGDSAAGISLDGIRAGRSIYNQTLDLGPDNKIILKENDLESFYFGCGDTCPKCGTKLQKDRIPLDPSGDEEDAYIAKCPRCGITNEVHIEGGPHWPDNGPWGFF
jgi:hypothetical protein